ncbi:MAG: O-antigen ligase family protein [Clostridia bacterium]|nr:O-antigen ligase family protein [Clostridia bacterium]
MEENQLKFETEEKWYYIVPLMFVLAFVPLVVFLRIVPLGKDAGSIWVNSKFDADFFSYYKAMLLLSCTLLLTAFQLFNILKTKALKRTYIYIPAGIYLLFVILSTIGSAHPEIALWGFPSRYEGALINISYVILLFASINLVTTEKQYRLVICSVIFSSSVIGIIGVFQYFGLDLFKSELGKILILPPDLRKMNLNFSFGKYTIYSTLFNTNNVGSFAAMLFPFSLALFFMAEKKVQRLLAGSFSCLMFMVWLGCLSRAGIMGGIAAVILVAVALRKRIQACFKPAAVLLVSYLLLYVIMNTVSGGYINNTAARAAGELSSADGGRVKDIAVGREQAVITSRSGTLKIVINKNELKFMNGENKTMEFEQKSDGQNMEFRFKEEGFKDCLVKYFSSGNVLGIDRAGLNLRLAVTNEGFMFVDSKGRLVPPSDIRKIRLPVGESFASGRGFIWSRSIPLMSDSLIIGKGPDTFPFYFPQHDFTGKLLGLSNQYILVDKPHNMYLHIGIGTGAVSLLAFLAIILMYFIQCCTILAKYSKQDLYWHAGIGIAAAVAGYLAAGVFNDSIVSVAPIFWVLLGLGININLRIKYS